MLPYGLLTCPCLLSILLAQASLEPYLHCRHICPYLLSSLLAQAASRPHLYCRHTCPYHASRDLLNEGASLIFLTYSQLFDPPVRSANGLDALLSGAVVVIDEASAGLSYSCPATN